LAYHLEIDEDPDPDHHFGADPEWILLIALMRIRILPFNLWVLAWIFLLLTVDNATVTLLKKNILKTIKSAVNKSG
jgi:hypothetical protein